MSWLCAADTSQTHLFMLTVESAKFHYEAPIVWIDVKLSFNMLNDYQTGNAWIMWVKFSCQTNSRYTDLVAALPNCISAMRLMISDDVDLVRGRTILISTAPTILPTFYYFQLQSVVYLDEGLFLFYKASAPNHGHHHNREIMSLSLKREHKGMQELWNVEL